MVMGRSGVATRGFWALACSFSYQLVGEDLARSWLHKLLRYMDMAQDLPFRIMSRWTSEFEIIDKKIVSAEHRLSWHEKWFGLLYEPICCLFSFAISNCKQCNWHQSPTCLLSRILFSPVLRIERRLLSRIFCPRNFLPTLNPTKKPGNLSLWNPRWLCKMSIFMQSYAKHPGKQVERHPTKTTFVLFQYGILRIGLGLMKRCCKLHSS